MTLESHGQSEDSDKSEFVIFCRFANWNTNCPVHSFTKTELGGIQFAQLPKSSKCVTPKEINSKREPYKNLCKFLEIRHNSPGYFYWINILQKEKYPMNFKLTWIDLQKLIWMNFLATFLTFAVKMPFSLILFSALSCIFAWKLNYSWETMSNWNFFIAYLSTFPIQWKLPLRRNFW